MLQILWKATEISKNVKVYYQHIRMPRFTFVAKQSLSENSNPFKYNVGTLFPVSSRKDMMLKSLTL